MKVGDRVKILPPQVEGAHEWTGSKGVITYKRDSGTWDFDVMIDGEQYSVPFHDFELEVIV